MQGHYTTKQARSTLRQQQVRVLVAPTFNTSNYDGWEPRWAAHLTLLFLPCT